MLNNKSFFRGINGDDAVRLLAEGDYLNMENFRNGVSGSTLNYQLENIPSTSSLFTIALSGESLPIGRVIDYSRLRLIWWNYNGNGEHGIYAYDIALNTTYIVLLSSQTEKGLNFSKSFRISRNARVIGDLLFWTDNNNEPQCINIERGIKLNQPGYSTNVSPYVVPLRYTESTVIERTGIYPLQVNKAYDFGFLNNYIENNAYQFTYRYWYKDYQYSALAAWSALVPYNAAEDFRNFIQLQFSFSEKIDDDIQQVDICTRYGNTGDVFIVKSYNKDYFYDRIAIQDHNSGTTQLGFAFYDNTQGIALDSITANTFFHNVALKAKTIDLARNRCFLANLLKGYNAPVISSLRATVTTINTGAGNNYNGTWGYVTLHANLTGGCQDTFMYPFVNTSTAPFSFYYFSSVRNSTIWNGGVGTVPGTININDAVFKGNTEADLITYLKATQYPYNFGAGCGIGSPIWQVPYQISYNSLGNVTMYDFLPVQITQFFKSASTYEINIEFKDGFARRCGVQKAGVQFIIPVRTYGQTNFSAGVQWTLSNVNALNEIPNWAYYYQIVIRKNQTTRFFEQAKATDTTYVLKNDDGTFTYGNTTLTDTTYAVAINISALTGFGMGYTFNEGDFMRLYFSAGGGVDDRNLRVLAQDGNWVLCAPQDCGTLNNTVAVIFELYTPYKAQLEDPYYETGNVYPIVNAGTVNRAYSTLVDIISGDVYALQRTLAAVNYIVEAMSPNDKVWQVWQTNTGWVNIYDSIGQQQKETAIDFSDTYIDGTKVNGLNNFEPLNTKDIGNTSGAIQKLQLTNKQQEDGTVMLVIAETETLSAYLSEVQLYAAAKAGDITTTSDVIGSINALKNSRGTINPESVVEYNGTVWWFDAIHGTIPQYADNGIVDVSEFKLYKFWDKFSKRYREQGKAVIEALCGFSYIEMCVDTSSKELLITIPQTEINVVTSGIPVGYAPALPSYSTLPAYASSIQNRFEIYDGQAKTMIYGYEENRWRGAYQWLPEIMEYAGNKLYGFKGNSLYLHNENTASYNTIYGVQYPQRLCFTSKMPPSAIEEILNIALETNAIPNYTVIYVAYPNIQITDLAYNDVDADGNLLWQNKEGIMYRAVLKDRLSPNTTGTADEKLFKGDVMRSVTPFIMIEFQEYVNKLILNFVNIGFQVSRGHSQIINPKS